MSHHSPHLCPVCHVCICGCDECGENLCWCMDCDCDTHEAHEIHINERHLEES
jgi:hypothetical protein